MEKKKWSEPEMAPMEILGGSLVMFNETFSAATTGRGTVNDDIS
ncbi:hypothetical protein ADIS_2104 [Lunatimonas lonarensis]|uniref:Uncharacterized protein n=1 Tax=Lunatimonas lonarensis TaxID=1232681 RepID=R7ZTT7_9BACT|nr:hypothetical protein ADIS_2104 [Lunatimonas lonarensis]